ncbi:MAG: hypothetical protein CM15mP42_11170 [Methanobacteriota archaeon]|nr:MAG: hypothetical protein CM15mP42_11170 [Euryarchaeota archaeon]
MCDAAEEYNQKRESCRWFKIAGFIKVAEAMLDQGVV